MEGYLGEIRLFAGFYAPLNWAFCDGSVLSIDDETFPLFQAIGSGYGGEGETTFALPGLRPRAGVGTRQGGGRTRYRIGGPPGSDESPTPPLPDPTGRVVTASRNG